MNEMKELDIQINASLTALQLKSSKLSLVKDVSIQFVIEEFGTIICGINRIDYSAVKKVVDEHYEDYRIIYITTNDTLLEKKYEIIWELMTGGYMRWIRLEHPRLFRNLITLENFGNRIITERMNRFAGKAKYNYLIAQNEWAKKVAETYVLSVDAGFYDMMPERS